MHTYTHAHAHRTEWKETARWLKFVEVAEPGGQKWSKPHVSTLAMHSLFQLRDLLLKAVILLDESGKDMPQIAGVGHCGVCVCVCVCVWCVVCDCECVCVSVWCVLGRGVVCVLGRGCGVCVGKGVWCVCWEGVWCVCWEGGVVRLLLLDRHQTLIRAM